MAQNYQVFTREQAFINDGGDRVVYHELVVAGQVMGEYYEVATTLKKDKLQMLKLIMKNSEDANITVGKGGSVETTVKPSDDDFLEDRSGSSDNQISLED